MSTPSLTPESYPIPGDADEDWWSEEEGCLHGIPWDEPCPECEDEDEETWLKWGYY